MMELASATPLNGSKFSGKQTTVTTSSLNTMGTKRMHKSADDDRMQADSPKKGDPGRWTSENGNELQTARPTRAGVSDEVAQEFQVISNGHTNIDGPQVNLQNEISDPDEYAKAADATAMREAERTDVSLKTKDEKRSRVANPTPPDPEFINSCGSPRDSICTEAVWVIQHTSWTDLNTMSSTEARLGKQKACTLVKHMDHLLQLIRSCPLRDTEHSMKKRDTEHSMSMQRHTTVQNMTTVEDGHNTADDGKTHSENRREIQTQHYSKLINLLEAEYILQIRESSENEEQHRRSFHETP